MTMPTLDTTFPWEPRQSLLGDRLLDAKGQPRSVWYALRCGARQEVAAVFRLIRLGVAEAWFPSKTVTRERRGRHYSVQTRLAPGYVFVRTDRVLHWHRLKELTQHAITGVVSIGVTPWEITEAAIARMTAVPERIEAERQEAEAARLQEASRQAALETGKQPVVGRPARLLDGPFAGQVVHVDGIHRARVMFAIGGVRASTPLDMAELAV